MNSQKQLQKWNLNFLFNILVADIEIFSKNYFWYFKYFSRYELIKFRYR